MAARDDKADAPADEDQPGDGGPREAAQLIAEVTSELASLSRRHGLDVLAHLLEMARLEADDIKRRNIDVPLN